jgi:hypothetical protein
VNPKLLPFAFAGTTFVPDGWLAFGMKPVVLVSLLGAVAVE